MGEICVPAPAVTAFHCFLFSEKFQTQENSESIRHLVPRPTDFDI